MNSLAPISTKVCCLRVNNPIMHPLMSRKIKPGSQDTTGFPDNAPAFPFSIEVLLKFQIFEVINQTLPFDKDRTSDCGYFCRIYCIMPSVHELTTQVPSPTLSGMPVEILNNIFSRLMNKKDRSLRNLLLVNKWMSSVAIKHLYLTFKPFYLKSWYPASLFEALASSVRGTSCFTHHLYVDEISNKTLHDAKDRLADERQEIMDKVLLGGRLRELTLWALPFPKLSLDCDFTRLTSLTVHFGPTYCADDLRSWMRTSSPRMRIETLMIHVSHSIILWTELHLPKNTLRLFQVSGSLSKVGQMQEISDSELSSAQTLRRDVFLASQCQTMHSLSLRTMHTKFTCPPLLYKLKRLWIQESFIDGWEILCGSLHSLKDLTLVNVNFPSIFAFPACVLPSLEILFFISEFDIKEVAPNWLDANARSFPGLRELEIRAISAETLAKFIANCPKLNVIEFTPEYRQLVSLPSDEHLQALSRCKISLRSLTMRHGQFSSAGLEKFSASVPASITTLDLSFSHGLTPTILRRFLKLPLRRFDVSYMPVRPEYLRELRAIAKHERPAGLIDFFGHLKRFDGG